MKPSQYCLSKQKAHSQLGSLVNSSRYLRKTLCQLFIVSYTRYSLILSNSVYEANITLVTKIKETITRKEAIDQCYSLTRMQKAATKYYKTNQAIWRKNCIHDQLELAQIGKSNSTLEK